MTHDTRITSTYAPYTLHTQSLLLSSQR
jgi:hypothetical protein